MKYITLSPLTIQYFQRCSTKLKIAGSRQLFSILSVFYFLSKPEYDSMPAFWIFPFNILVRAANPAASAFVAAFVTYLHPFALPFVNLGWAENGTQLVRTLSHAYVMIKYR